MVSRRPAAILHPPARPNQHPDDGCRGATGAGHGTGSRRLSVLVPGHPGDRGNVRAPDPAANRPPAIPRPVLDFLLPSFDIFARVLKPLTAGMLRMGTSSHRKRPLGRQKKSFWRAQQANGKGQPADAVVEVVAPPPPPEVEAVQEGQARELLRNLADFRETMVREVIEAAARHHLHRQPTPPSNSFYALVPRAAVFARPRCSRIPWIT